MSFPLDQWLLALVDWIREAGALGVAAFAIVYVLATVFALPGSVLTLGAGFAYGPLWGALLVSPVSVLAATVAFLLGRGAARPWVVRRMERYPRFARVNEAVSASGFKLVLLLRLSPLLPFNLLNYALSLTRVSLRDYVLASFLGMLPATFGYVYIGSLVTSASELASGARARGGTWEQALYWGGLVATIAATVWITRVARRALDRSLDSAASGAAPSAPAKS